MKRSVYDMAPPESGVTSENDKRYTEAAKTASALILSFICIIQNMDRFSLPGKCKLFLNFLKPNFDYVRFNSDF